jgi:hypothetical protein
MHTEDQVAEWLVRWEEAQAANAPAPGLDQLPPELHERAREGLRLLRGFAAGPYGPAPRDGAPEGRPPDTPRYRFEQFLAEGGMGEVWRGYDVVMQRELALKVLRQRINRAEAEARFAEEARQVGQLQHPSIVPVYDMGELPDGRPFFAMRLIHGHTLADLLRGREPAEELLRWVEVFEQVCQAMAYAHARGVVHRDLKPSNVMVGEFGEVLVMDWGIAKALVGPDAAPEPPAPAAGALAADTETTGSGGSATTRSTHVKGTPAFMAPEQARGAVGRIGKASDVFGLGGILCVILTGQPPFTQAGQAPAGDVSGAFARLDGCGADRELIALAKACLAPDPEERPADAEAVAGRVKAYREGVAERQCQAEARAAATRERRRLLRQAEIGRTLLGERAWWLWSRPGAEPADRTNPEGENATEAPAVEAARARLRQQALALLRAEVAAQAKQLSGEKPAEAVAARQVLASLRGLPALAGVRDPGALPEPERTQWRQFWEEVEELLRRGEVNGSGVAAPAEQR